MQIGLKICKYHILFPVRKGFWKGFGKTFFLKKGFPEKNPPMFKSKNAYEKNSWMLVIYCWLAYATVYIGRKNLSVCLADMIAEGVTDKVSGGTIGTCFMLCYAIGQFVGNVAK